MHIKLFFVTLTIGTLYILRRIVSVHCYEIQIRSVKEIKSIFTKIDWRQIVFFYEKGVH